MNLPPPTEKRNPTLKSEAPFQDMIPRKKKHKKMKAVINTCVPNILVIINCVSALEKNDRNSTKM